MKILVFTTDVIPLPGLPTSGTALRTFGLIQGFRAHGHEVLVSVPRSALQGLTKNFDIPSLPLPVRQELDELRELAFDSLNQSYIVNQINPDMILCGHWPAYTFQTKPSQPVVVDLAGPHLLERHFQGSPNHTGATMGKLAIVASADQFIVSGPTQRLYFLSFMLRAGVPQPEKRIVEITMPLSPTIPERSFSDFPNNRYPRFVFGGVFLPWQNPAAALEQLSDTLNKKKSGMLTLIGGSHPNYKIKEGIYTKLFDRLAKQSSVVTKPMLPYEEFLEELGRCDVALDVMKWNLERELAMTIRSTTYLWAGVPIIYNDYADLGKLIRKYDAGWTVNPAKPEQLQAVLEEIFARPELVKQKSLNASRLAQEVFSWDKAVLPLLQSIVRQDSVTKREIDIIMDFPDRADLSLREGSPVEQYFCARMDGLNKIECRMATHGASIDTPVSFRLYEIDEAASVSGTLGPNSPRRLVTQQMTPGKEIKNNEWHSLEINPITDSAGKYYALRIEAGSPVSARTAMSPWAVRGQPYPLMSLYHGNKVVAETSLCLRTSCLSEGSAALT